jgi:type II secretory pathway component GspD/PulD (secretin)
MVISSQDTAALDLLEELLAQIAPQRKDFRVFSLKYASSLWVKMNLEDYFKEEPDDKSKRRSYFFYDFPPPEDKAKSYRLSQRKPLKFIDDLDTNTILVLGANAEQLKTIEELIRLWDTPPPNDTESARMTAVFQIRYSKAETVAETVKEVYLDLLSSNDRALQRGRDERRSSNQTTYIFGESGGGEPDRRAEVSFKGKLSIGVDPVTNTLLVSTAGQTLMDNVSKMIQALDEAAKPVFDVQTITLKGNLNAERVRKVLAEMLGEKVIQPGQAGGPNQPPGGPQPGQPGGPQPRSGGGR